jgi:uncharacterized protein YggL (DUF469 family)
MIDTIILTIPAKDLKMLNENVFDVQPWNLQADTPAYKKFTKNPSLKLLKSGLYFPRLTGYNRNNIDTEAIKFEFSAPKLLYLNNLDELEDNQFKELISTLQDRLKQMGVIASYDTLANAPVTTVHYSKNIELTGGHTSQYVISELNKINLNKRFDLTKARYVNDGESLTAFSLTNSFVIYDKIADLNKDKKRTTDKDQPLYQLSLFKKLGRSKEIIRFEVRLCKKQKIKALFKELGFTDNLTFKDVFSVTKSKAVLLQYWTKMIEDNNLLLFAHSTSAKDLLKQICLAHPEAKSKTSIYLVGLLCLARDGNGLRELRTMLAKRNNSRTWYRTVTDLKELSKTLESLKPREWFNQIKTALARYETIHI